MCPCFLSSNENERNCDLCIFGHCVFLCTIYFHIHMHAAWLMLAYEKQFLRLCVFLITF